MSAPTLLDATRAAAQAETPDANQALLLQLQSLGGLSNMSLAAAHAETLDGGWAAFLHTRGVACRSSFFAEMFATQAETLDAGQTTSLILQGLAGEFFDVSLAAAKTPGGGQAMSLVLQALAGESFFLDANLAAPHAATPAAGRRAR